MCYDDHAYCLECDKHELACYCFHVHAPDEDEIKSVCLEHDTTLPVSRRAAEELRARGIEFVGRVDGERVLQPGEAIVAISDTVNGQVATPERPIVLEQG